MGFAGCEFEIVFELGAEGVRVEGFGDVVRDVHWGRGPAMAGWFVGDKHGVETAGLKEVGVHFVKEVVCPVGCA